MKSISPVRIYRVLSRWLRPNQPLAQQLTSDGDTGVEVAAAVLDVDAAVGRLMGDKQLYHQLLAIFIQTYSTVGEKLRAALPGRSAEAIRIVHTLKGAASTIGAEQLTTAAARLEKGLARGASQAIAVQLLALESALCAALIAAERFRTDSPAD